MSCSFFCDTGTIIGYCDPNDFHNEPCEFFFNKYPKDDNDYFITNAVENELKGKRRKYIKKINRSSSTSEKTRIRKIQMCIERHIRTLNNYTCIDTHPNIDDLIITLQKVITVKAVNQINDINIVANAIIWSLELINGPSTLITLDRGDISSKESKIKRECEKTLSQGIPLTIIYLPYYYKLKLHSK